MVPVTSFTKTYDCGLCGAELHSKWALDNHLCLFHDVCDPVRPGAQVTFRCAVCDSAFSRRAELMEHMKSSGHGRPTGPGEGSPRRGASRAASRRRT
jgi:hypothetical protein